MPSFPWLPLQTKLSESTHSGRVLEEGIGYQILDCSDNSKVILLIKQDAAWLSKLNGTRTQHDILIQIGLINDLKFDDVNYCYGLFDKTQAPIQLDKLVKSIGVAASGSLLTLANAISEMNELYPESVWNTALFLQGEKICIATEFDAKQSSAAQRQKLAMRLLVGAVEDTNLTPDVIRKCNPKLTTAEIRDFLSILDIKDQTFAKLLDRAAISDPERFTLTGRPELETFFREHVIDYFHRYSEYQLMGINPPNGILLYGPPGTGKTHSVKALADFLGWKVFEIDVGSIGSPYIHQTSKILKEIFEQAAQSAPSIVLMEEIDALGGSRSPGMNEHKIEEIAQLLRLIETASKQGILVIGTTNRFHSMDDAIVRKGRFDHVIELGLPKAEEILSALKGMLKGKPAEPDLKLEQFAENLSGRPMSDVAWAVNEAAKAAVRSGKKKIDNDCLEQAFSIMGSKI